MYRRCHNFCQISFALEAIKASIIGLFDMIIQLSFNTLVLYLQSFIAWFNLNKAMWFYLLTL